MKKKSFYLWAMMLVAVLCVGFTSCSNDDDEDDDDVVTGTGIVGTWQFDAVENYYYDGTSDSYTNYSRYENSYAMYLKFNANGSGTSYEFDDGKWYVSPYTYNFDGKYITVPDKDGKVEVLKLTDSKLSFKITADEEDFDDKNVEYMIQTYKRVSDSKVKDAK